MKKDLKKLAETIIKARENKGLGQRELAREAHVDNGEISRVEACKRQKPNVLFLRAIADVLNLSMVELMELSGYNDYEINWGTDLSEKRSIKDYQNALSDYNRFYFDVLEDIQKRRDNDFEIKNIIVGLIEKLEHPEFYSKELTNKDILDELNKAFSFVRPNLEKFDKEKYPKYDDGLFPKEKLSTPTLNTMTGTFVDDKN